MKTTVALVLGLLFAVAGWADSPSPSPKPTDGRDCPTYYGVPYYSPHHRQTRQSCGRVVQANIKFPGTLVGIEDKNGDESGWVYMGFEIHVKINGKDATFMHDLGFESSRHPAHSEYTNTWHLFMNYGGDDYEPVPQALKYWFLPRGSQATMTASLLADGSMKLEVSAPGQKVPDFPGKIPTGKPYIGSPNAALRTVTGLTMWSAWPYHPKPKPGSFANYGYSWPKKCVFAEKDISMRTVTWSGLRVGLDAANLHPWDKDNTKTDTDHDTRVKSWVHANRTPGDWQAYTVGIYRPSVGSPPPTKTLTHK